MFNATYLKDLWPFVVNTSKNSKLGCYKATFSSKIMGNFTLILSIRVDSCE